VWPDNRPAAEADGLTFSSYGYDEVFPNLAGNDYFGNEFELWQLYGSIILIDFSAGWCSPCQTVASEAQDFWDERREEGFVIFHAMQDDWTGGAADNTFIVDWSDSYGLGFPVVGEGDVNTVASALYSAGLNEGYIPYMILLNSDMTIDTQYIGSGNDGAIGARVDELMNK
jgi:thiol-disulfide isomerase/thioredoxin